MGNEALHKEVMLTVNGLSMTPRGIKGGEDPKQGGANPQGNGEQSIHVGMTPTFANT